MTKTLKDGIFDRNPIFMQVIGMCPTLAVTTSAINGLGMGVATTVVMICANLVVSLIRKLVPSSVRIPCFVVIIATFATVVQFLLKAFIPELDAALGIFIPLIAVNCVIMARAESFAFKNGPLATIVDSVGMGLGFTAALCSIGIIRELIGTGKIFQIEILPDIVPRTIIMILPPGAFFTLAAMMAVMNYFKSKKQA